MASIRTLGAALLAASVTTAVQAQWWNSQDPLPPGQRAVTKVELTYQLLKRAEGEVAVAAGNGDWQKVERMYEEFMAGNLRATDGSFMVEAIQTAFDMRYRVLGEDLARDDFVEWRRKVPESKLRPVIQAVMHMRHAWNVRGPHYAQMVPAEAMQLFRERMAVAAKSIADADAQGRDTPIWWWVAMVVAGSSGAGPERLDEIFEQSVQRFPLYRPLYYTRLNYHLPQWGGSVDAMERFVMRSVERTQATEGKSFYALLYTEIAPVIKDGDVFSATRLDWTRMRMSFDDLLARNPDAWNRNLYATFACRARDRETTARLLTELGPRPAIGYKSPGISTEACRRFAFDRS